jgi:sulfate transport system ATP-binding protein
VTAAEIALVGVERTFVTDRRGHEVLGGIDLRVAAGEVVALLGASGSGKSTLLRLAGGLDRPTGGAVRIDGRPVRGIDARTAFVFQEARLLPWRTLAGNVALGLPRGTERPAGRERVAALLEQVHLADFAGHRPRGVSGGMAQRTALARALARNPGVLLLDEPFGALDATVRKELRDWLRRLHDEVHVTTIFVTHDQEEALEVAQQVAVINAGRIEQTGTPDDLYEGPANPFVMGFVGPVSRLGETWVRPHDIELLDDREDGAIEALIERVARVGFEVRVEASLGDGSPVPVLTTRDRADELELRPGQLVWLRVHRVRAFAA